MAANNPERTCCLVLAVAVGRNGEQDEEEKQMSMGSGLVAKGKGETTSAVEPCMCVATGSQRGRMCIY